MQIDVLTLFPGIFQSPLQESILAKAIHRGLVTISVHNLRDWCRDKHRTADDSSYGGGPGMVMLPGPLFSALELIKSRRKSPRTIYLSPQGQVFDQALANRLAKESELIFLCGRYEGIDERVRASLVDEEISIGDFVMNGGEIPALVIIETITRLIPGVVGDEQSIIQDSFYSGMLDCPHYSKPVEFRGMRVPDILMSGNHKNIDKWRKETARETTRKNRPDLLNMN